MLNPETNSDSPSAKSKGVRLVSAKQEVTQHKKIGALPRMNQEVCCTDTIALKEYLPLSKIMHKKIKARLTS